MRTTECIVIGIAVRARWLGFAALAAQCQLLDWGMIYYQRRNAAQIKGAKRRVERILSLINPAKLVLLQPQLKTNQERATVRSLARAIRTFASEKSISVEYISRDEVRKAFRQFRARSKEEIASVVASTFPELAWRLPPKRSIWRKEDSRLTLFDAVACAMALFRDSELGANGPSQPVAPSCRPPGDV